MRKNKLLLLLVLLMTAATGAWAQTETLLTTITATGETTYSETTAGVVTVTPSNMGRYSENYGWIWTGSGSVTVEAKEGYTITKCVFKQNAKTPVTITTSPFAITFDELGDCVQNYNMNGVTSIEVYGPAAAATGYSVTLAEGTEDANKWTVKVGEEAAAFPVGGLKGGEKITLTYNGSREVKSVTVVKKGGAVDNTYLEWNRKQKQLVATEMPTTYKTVENANAGVTWEAGTYVVEGQVNINGTIELSGAVNLIIKDDAKLTANKIIGNSQKLYIYGQAQKSGELVVHCSDDNAFLDLSTLEVHSAKVTAASSKSGCGGFKNIVTFNVYGGLVDAKGTVANGYGICMNQGGSMNIYGGEVKAEGKGNNPAWSCAILCTYYGYKAPVTVFGGKLWAGSADANAFYEVDLTKDNGYTSGKIEYSLDNSNWSETVGTPDSKYVRVGY